MERRRNWHRRGPKITRSPPRVALHHDSLYRLVGTTTRDSEEAAQGPDHRPAILENADEGCDRRLAITFWWLPVLGPPASTVTSSFGEETTNA
jgi:hypothetical protein